jgi:hypothetical protein
MASSVLPVTDTSPGQAVMRRTLQLMVSKKENKFKYFYKKYIQYRYLNNSSKKGILCLVCKTQQACSPTK